MQRPPVFGLTNRYVDPNDPSTQAGAQRLSNYYGLPGRFLTGDPRNVIAPEVPGQWSDRDEARAALQAGNMTLGGMGMGVDATTGAMPRGFAGTANTLGVGGGRPPRIGDVANPVLGEVAALDKPALSGEVLPPVPLAGGRQLAGVSAEQRAKLGPMVAQLEKLGATPEQMASFTPQEAYDFIKARNMPQPIRRTVNYRDPSGRPVRTEPLPRSTQEILETGYKRATEPLPPGVEQPPLMQAAERKGAMGSVANLTTPQGIRAYHTSPHDFERFDINRAGTTTDAGKLGEAVYFTTDPKKPPGKENQRGYEVSLGVKNPLELKYPFDQFRFYDKSNIIKDALGLPATATAKDITAAVKAKGYDAVTLDYSPAGYKQREIAVFNDKLIDILRKYGIAGMLGGGAAMGGSRRPESVCTVRIIASASACDSELAPCALPSGSCLVRNGLYCQCAQE